MRATPLTIIVLAAACGGSSPPETFPPSWVGTDAASRTGETGNEVARAGLPRETLVDDAVLTYLDEQTACFDLAVRSTAASDRALSELGAECRAEDTSSAAELSAEEMVSVYDYDADGQLAEVVTEDVPAEAYDRSPEAPPSGELHRIVERRSRLCCPVPRADVLVLALPGLELSWQMQDQ